MSQNVGEIDLDLVLQSNTFRRQLNDSVNSAMRNVNRQTTALSGTFSKFAKVMGAAFAVDKIVKFGAECTKLGSDLAEVQNVVDVSFGNMAEEINRFASNAMETYGLSETMAKKYAGAFGAMSSSMGFTQQEAVKMSETLTGLAGDVASFYNMSQDEAYTKLKSVFTGETETLKDLGVVMTQANLDNYALANGFGKTTSKMNETEKTALRYQFVLDKLNNAQGDFARTSDSWANQTRVLSLRFDALKASLGQGFINVLTPVIKMLNTLLAKLQKVADAFANFTAAIMGKKAEQSGTANIAADLATSATNAEETEKGLTGVGKAAKKAVKSMMGIDELNTLTDASSADTGASSGGSSGGSGVDFSDIEDMGNVVSETEKKINPMLQSIIGYMKELSGIFQNGFKAGFGDVSLEPLKKSAQSIGKSLKEIFTDPQVLTAADNFVKTSAYSLGQFAGAAASIGITIATNLVGGIDLYLAQNVDRIKKFLVDMFDINSEVATIAGDFAQAASNIFSAFGSENGQQLTANLIGIFADATMGVCELMAKAGRDVMKVFCQPIIDNQGAIKTALEGILGVFATVTGAIKEVVDGVVDKANEVYDTCIAPFFQSLAGGLSDTAGKFLEFWNGSVQPVLEQLAQKFSEVMTTCIQPLFESACELIGKVFQLLQAFWETILKPLIDWIIQNVLPVVLPIIQSVLEGIITFVGNIAVVLQGIITAISGVIDIIRGIMTGDWTLVWEGIKEVASGIWDAMKGIIKTAINAIKSIISIALNVIKGIFSVVWNAIKSVVSTVWNGIKLVISVALNAIKTVINKVFGTIKGIISTIFNAIKTKISTVWNGIKEKISSVSSAIKTGIETVFGGIKKFWEEIWGGIKDTAVKAFEGLWNGIKGIINTILGGIESMVNGIIKGINLMVKALNSLSFDVPDWVPKIGGKSLGFNIQELATVSLPRLANGGYVKANTPQLAMIGDNTHEGEIVAPESKIAEAVAAGMSGAISQLATLLGGNSSSEQPINIYLGNELIDSMIVGSNNRRALRSGGRA